MHNGSPKAQQFQPTPPTQISPPLFCKYDSILMTPMTQCPPKQNFSNESVLLKVLKTTDIRKGNVFKIQIHFLISPCPLRAACQLNVCQSPHYTEFVFYFIPFAFIFAINSYFYGTKWTSGNITPLTTLCSCVLKRLRSDGGRRPC
jgi:hypothetical protein